MTDSAQTPAIAAVIAAAGRSTRMGEPKQLMAWGDHTILGTVVANLVASGAAPVICVVGHRAEEMIAALGDAPAEVIINSAYLQGEMLSSYQAGVRRLSASGREFAGTLLALGDQPHVPVTVLRAVLSQARKTPDNIVMPRYAGRRGHPFYFPQRLWPALLALGHDETLRTIVRDADEHIEYVEVETDAILRDIDTPGDYRRLTAAESD